MSSRLSGRPAATSHGAAPADPRGPVCHREVSPVDVIG